MKILLIPQTILLEAVHFVFYMVLMSFTKT